MNHNSHSLKILFPIFAIILIISIACQIPAGLSGEKSPESDLEATIAVLQTQVNEQGGVDENPSENEIVTPTENPIPTQTVVTPPQDSPVQDETSLYQGIYVLQNNWFSPFDMSGNSLGDGFPSGNNNWYGENEVESWINEIFYTEFSGEPTSVYRVNAQGTTTLDFIASLDPISIAVSPDRKLIAWATSRWEDGLMQTEIYYSNLDGSNIQLIDSMSGEEQLEFPRIFYPIRWTEEGRLLYATGMTGIGGYMLFWGYNGLFLYNPLDNTTRTLVDDDERLGICLSSASNDLEMISIVCGSENNVRVRALDTGVEIAFPLVQDQVMAGSARFSPSGEWLAYVVQSADPMQEIGKVVLVPVDGSQPPRVLASVEDGSFNVEGWMSEKDIIVTQSNLSTNQNTVLRIARDGSQVSQIATGTFIDFIP
jgi:hypothetical protein